MFIYFIKGKNKISEIIKVFVKNKFEALKADKKKAYSKKNKNKNRSTNNIIEVIKENSKQKINNKKTEKKLIEYNIKKEGNNKALKDLISNKPNKKRTNSIIITNNKKLNNDKIKKILYEININNNFPPKKKDKNTQININNNVFNINLNQSYKSINSNNTNLGSKIINKNSSRKNLGYSPMSEKRIINASKKNVIVGYRKSKYFNSDFERLELGQKKQDLIDYIKTNVKFQNEYLAMLNRYIGASDATYGQLLDERASAEIDNQEAVVEVSE